MSGNVRFAVKFYKIFSILQKFRHITNIYEGGWIIIVSSVQKIFVLRWWLLNTEVKCFRFQYVQIYSPTWCINIFMEGRKKIKGLFSKSFYRELLRSLGWFGAFWAILMIVNITWDRTGIKHFITECKLSEFILQHKWQ